MMKLQSLLKIITLGLCIIFPFAATAEIVVVVNKANTIEALQADDVRRIFLGRVGAFPQTGKPMQVLDQNKSSDAYKQFYEEIVGFKIRHLIRYRAAYVFSGRGAVPKVTGKDSEVKEQVIANASAIGYLDARYVDDSLKVVYRHK
jgi:ABC-type phosphate transport system substrate-binding protein